MTKKKSKDEKWNYSQKRLKGFMEKLRWENKQHSWIIDTEMQIGVYKYAKLRVIRDMICKILTDKYFYPEVYQAILLGNLKDVVALLDFHAINNHINNLNNKIIMALNHVEQIEDRLSNDNTGKKLEIENLEQMIEDIDPIPSKDGDYDENEGCNLDGLTMDFDQLRAKNNVHISKHPQLFKLLFHFLCSEPFLNAYPNYDWIINISFTEFIDTNDIEIDAIHDFQVLLKEKINTWMNINLDDIFSIDPVEFLNDFDPNC